MPRWLVFLLGLLCAMGHHPAVGDTGGALRSTWHTGLNETLIESYLTQQRVGKVNPATNMQPRALNEIGCRLLDLQNQRHVGAYRDIASFQQVQPFADFDDPRNLANRQKILDVISIYARLNLRLVLTFGLPMPGWMSIRQQDGDWAPLPPAGDEQRWSVLKDRMAWAIGNFVRWLAQNGVSEAWMANRLYIEGINEFDGLRDTSNHWNCWEVGSPERAASLQGGINAVLNHYGVKVLQTSPSMVGLCEYGDWFSRYYDAGGGGYPNIHIYGLDRTTDPVGFVRRHVARLEEVVPANWRSEIILGETGVSEVSCALNCPNPDEPEKLEGMSAAQRRFAYADIAADSDIRKHTHLLLFWRMLGFSSNDPKLGCERSMGVTSADNQAYLEAGNNLFAGLGGTPGNGSEACTPVDNAARFISQSVPHEVDASSQFEVFIRMRNVGTTVWSDPMRYKLGSQVPQDSTIWGTNRIALSGDVTPGEEVEFTTSLTAPSAPGVYSFAWRLVQDGVSWFGDYSPILQVRVQ